MGRTPDQSIVDEALLEVCLGGNPELPDDPVAVEDFIAAARFHRIAPLAFTAFAGTRPDVAKQLRSDRDVAVLNHLRMTAVLAELARLLDPVPWLVFKGPVLSELAHPVPGLRFYKDLDLLVAPGDFRAACEVLFDRGWGLVLGNESLLSREFPGEIPLMNPQGVVMDLHWSMQVMKSVRGRFAMESGPLLERRVPVSIGSVQLAALEPADALVHVCQHAALVGATRLGHVLDADQLARNLTDWDELIVRALQWRTGAQVAAVLLRAERLFGTPVPDDLTRRLGIGAGLTKAMATVDRVAPIQALRRDESWVRLITRSLRPSLPRTLGVAVRRTAQGITSRLHRAAPQQPRSKADPQVVESYLARVEALAV